MKNQRLARLRFLSTVVLLTFGISHSVASARVLRPDAQLTTTVDTLGVQLPSSKVAQGDIPDRIRMALDGRDVLLRLVPSGLFDPGAVIRFYSGPTPVELPVPKVFVGSIDGQAGSGVYLAMSTAGISGFIARDGVSGWTIEPRRLYQPEAPLADVVAIPDAVSAVGPCGTLVHDAAQLASAVPAPLTATISPDFEENLVGTTERVYRLQVAADSYYLATMGNDALAVGNRIGAELAFTRLWLQRDIGLSLKADIRVFSTIDDPFLGTGPIWPTKVAAYRATNVNTAAAAQVFYGGPNPIDPFAGIAQVHQLCNSFAYSLVTYRASSSMTEAILAAHEFGHNLGAAHSDVFAACGELTVPQVICSGGVHEGTACSGGSVLSCCAVPDECTQTELSQIFAHDIECVLNANLPIMWSNVGNNQPTPYYDECSVNAITGYALGSSLTKNATQPWACWNNGIQCGDFDHSGTIVASDAQATLVLASCSTCPYNAYADVVSPFNVTGGVLASDALRVLRISVGLDTSPTNCGAS